MSYFGPGYSLTASAQGGAINDTTTSTTSTWSSAKTTNAIIAAVAPYALRVGSIDGVQTNGGNVDLIAGGGVTIVPNDTLDTITISTAPINDASVLTTELLSAAQIDTRIAASVPTPLTLATIAGTTDDITQGSTNLFKTAADVATLAGAVQTDAATTPLTSALKLYPGVPGGSEPVSLDFYCSYAVNQNANTSNGSATGTLTAATVAGGRLQMLGNDITRAVDYVGLGNVDQSNDQFTIRMGIVPNFTTPSNQQPLLWIYSNTPALRNFVKLNWIGDNIRLDINDSAGASVIANKTFPVGPVTLGALVDFELNVDIVSGATRLFKNGVQVGTTATSTGSRDVTTTPPTTFKLGGGTMDLEIEYFHVFSGVRHTGNFTPDSGEYPQIVLPMQFATTNGMMKETGPADLNGAGDSLGVFVDNTSNPGVTNKVAGFNNSGLEVIKGGIDLHSLPITNAATYNGYTPANSADVLALAGGTMTGSLNMGNQTITNVSASSALVTSFNGATGDIVVPTSAGFIVKEQCRLATIAALPACTYANGAVGVGATLTEDVAAAGLTIDGVAAVNGNRVLIKDQAAGLQNGIYVVTEAGDAVTQFILTRADDLDGSPTKEVRGGVWTYVTAGTLADTQWTLQDAGTGADHVVGTDTLTWFQMQATGQLVTSVAGKQGVVTLVPTDVQLASLSQTGTTLNTLNNAVINMNSDGNSSTPRIFMNPTDGQPGSAAFGLSSAAGQLVASSAQGDVCVQAAAGQAIVLGTAPEQWMRADTSAVTLSKNLAMGSFAITGTAPLASGQISGLNAAIDARITPGSAHATQQNNTGAVSVTNAGAAMTFPNADGIGPTGITVSGGGDLFTATNAGWYLVTASVPIYNANGTDITLTAWIEDGSGNYYGQSNARVSPALGSDWVHLNPTALVNLGALGTVKVMARSDRVGGSTAGNATPEGRMRCYVTRMF